MMMMRAIPAVMVAEVRRGTVRALMLIQKLDVLELKESHETRALTAREERDLLKALLLLN